MICIYYIFYDNTLLVIDNVSFLFFPPSLYDLANFYCNQDMFQEAEPLIKRCYELRRQLLGLQSVATLDSMNSLAVLYAKQVHYLKLRF